MKRHPFTFAALALAASACSAETGSHEIGDSPPAHAATADAGADVARAPGWFTGAPMLEMRASHELTALPDGRALATGGETFLFLDTEVSSTEIFDPATRTWAAAAPMLVARDAHRATLLDDGRVLVTGGVNFGFPNVEVYDPAANTWEIVASMLDARCCHAAARLPDGRVLVAGGYRNEGNVRYREVEIYDPGTDVWTAAASMATRRSHFPLVTLPDGRLLAVGGVGAEGVPITSAEVYDPVTGAWSTAGAMSTPRRDHAAALLPGGRILAIGGGKGKLADGAAPGTDVHDPDSGAWSSGPALLGEYRYPSAIGLAGGELLVVGGQQTFTEIYDPATDTTTPAGDTSATHDFARAVMLADGAVLIAGGAVAGGMASMADTDLHGLLAAGAACKGYGMCASGFCADGVCCDSPCGGGVEDDCEVCSAARGAAEDGVCASLPALPGGGCEKACKTVHDCPAPLACDASGRCVERPSDPGGSDDGSGCGVAVPARGGVSAGLAGVIAALAWSRRRRSARR